MSDTSDLDDWANEEFGAAELGDARLTRRLVTLARKLSLGPHCSFPQSFNGSELNAGSDPHVRGFLIHSLLALTPEGLPLGLIGMKIWIRRHEELGKKHLRAQRTVQQKESAKWLEGIEQLGVLKTHCPCTHVIGVSDR
ncbi:IS4/Tn5 family transposase DNA-binding protein, partial [Paraburkholderia fynbosensis]|uniref:IS4/Tn5 family transposase DNA-binding protein n=1 Tax=Paraburkholderia fynbosensis TaxID=1200993 RepID=UPI001581E655